MLRSLSVKNYALIEELNVNFQNDFSVITGETGAGKSILLGALGLVLGNRADYNALKNTNEKCVIEAVFDIHKYNLTQFFVNNDLDIELQTIIRREILPSGKSRAFVNDTPTTLGILKSLSEQLIDIHSQHQTIAISDKNFQMQFIDAIANHQTDLQNYNSHLQKYKQSKKNLDHLKQLQKEYNESQEYNQFLLNEFLEVNLQENEQTELEQRLKKLNHIEDIKQKLFVSDQLLNDEEKGITNTLNSLKNNFEQLSNISEDYSNLKNRLESCYIELEDITNEINNLQETQEYNHNELQQINDRLQIIYDLQRKHNVDSISELLKIQKTLNTKVQSLENADEEIQNKEKEITEIEKNLNEIGNILNQNRKEVIPQIENSIHHYLNDLGMEDAEIQLHLESTQEFTETGKNKIEYLLSANRGGTKQDIAKVASGGELSRIMFSLKVILSSYSQLPTIIFDEIDTGISGKIADKMATMMQQLSEKMQVIAITHLPQLAAKGHTHYKVFKVTGEVPETKIIQLNQEEKITEISQMISGDEVSVQAIAQAKQLLQL